MERAQPNHIAAIDLIRFAAALLVVAYHYFTCFPLALDSATHTYDPALSLPGDAAALSWCGWVGVEIFFVVSGYVIARSAVGATPHQFLYRRMLRLVPAAWLCASLTLLVAATADGLDIFTLSSRWAAALLFVPVRDPIDASYWTLGVELVFYLLVAATMRQASAARIERIGLAIGGASLLFWAGMGIGMMNVPPDQVLRTFAFQLLLLPYGLLFALGMALAALTERATAARIIVVIAFTAGSAAVVGFHAGALAGVDGLIGRPVLPILVFLVSVAAIIGAARLQRPLVKIFGARWLKTMGLMTYPLYLLHQEIGAVAIVAAVHAGVPAYVAMLLTAGAMIVLAWYIAVAAEPRLRAALAIALDRLSRHDLARGIRPSASPPAG